MNCPDCGSGIFDRESVISEMEFNLFQRDIKKEFRKLPDRESIELWEIWKREKEEEALSLLTEMSPEPA